MYDSIDIEKQELIYQVVIDPSIQVEIEKGKFGVFRDRYIATMRKQLECVPKEIKTKERAIKVPLTIWSFIKSKYPKLQKIFKKPKIREYHLYTNYKYNLFFPNVSELSEVKRVSEKSRYELHFIARDQKNQDKTEVGTIFGGGRQKGKTVKLIELSYKLAVPILCFSKNEANHIKQQAKELNFYIPEPLTPTCLQKIKGKPSRVLVDEVEQVLGKALNVKPIILTTSYTFNYK